MNPRVLLLLPTLLCLASCLFSPTSAVIKLTSKNFDKQVLASDQVWLVQFYAPWCGHCKHSAPEFEKAAEILNGIVKVGAVDMDAHKSVGEKYGVSSYPTIKVFGRDKTKPYDYASGERTFDRFVNFSLGKVKFEISGRIDEINGRVGVKESHQAIDDTEPKTDTEDEL